MYIDKLDEIQQQFSSNNRNEASTMLSRVRILSMVFGNNDEDPNFKLRDHITTSK